MQYSGNLDFNYNYVPHIFDPLKIYDLLGTLILFIKSKRNKNIFIEKIFNTKYGFIYIRFTKGIFNKNKIVYENLYKLMLRRQKC